MPRSRSALPTRPSEVDEPGGLEPLDAIPSGALRHAGGPSELNGGHDPVLIQQHEQVVGRPARRTQAGDQGPVSHGEPPSADIAAQG